MDLLQVLTLELTEGLQSRSRTLCRHEHSLQSTPLAFFVTMWTLKHAYSQSANVLHTCSTKSERQEADDLFQLAEKFELNYPAGVCGWTQSPEDHAGL